MYYLDQLSKYHQQHGVKLDRFPSVDRRPLDLYKLKKAVEGRGGFEAVCKSKKWAEIGRDLGYGGKIMTSLSTNLRNMYQRWLNPYETYLQLAKPGVQKQLEMEQGGPFIPAPRLGQMSQKPSDKDRNQTSATFSEFSCPKSTAAIDRPTEAEGTNDEAPTPATTEAAPSTTSGSGPTASSQAACSVTASNTPAVKNGACNNTFPTRKSKRVSEHRRRSRESTADGRSDYLVKREISNDNSGGGFQTENDEGNGIGRRSKRLKRGK